MLFVGVLTETSTSFSTEVFESESFRVGTFDAEKSVALMDLKCSACILKESCQRCKHTNTPKSIADLEETRMIDESISCVPVPDKKDIWQFELDYPVLPDVNLTEKYQCGANSNKNVAIQSSTNLRKKLERENLLDEFHEQITKALDKGEFLQVSEEVERAHEGLAKSWQLINFFL